MSGGKLFCGTNVSSPEPSTGHLFRPFFKKRGGGKGDWGCPGDEMVEAPVDPRDPNFESDWSDAELEAALREHLQPRADGARSPTSDDDFVFAVDCDAKPSEFAVATVDCDAKPSEFAAAFAPWTHESPKGSWLNGFGEPTLLKLPANAVWPEVPPTDDASTRSFFFD